MELGQAVERVLLGESIQSIATGYRKHLVDAFGLDPEDLDPTTFAEETRLFVNNLCRQLGDRHAGDRRAMVALADWVERSREYEAWDALLSNFDFDGKQALVERGRVLFAGPMTAHW